VGIGTTGTISYKLSVDAGATANGGIYMNGTASPNLVFASSGTNRGRIGVSTVGGNFSTDSAANDVIIRTENTAYKLLFNTNGGSGASTLSLNGSSVGIGNTNNTYALDVTGQVNASTGFRVAGTAGVSPTTATVCSGGTPNYTPTAVIGGLISAGSCTASGALTGAGATNQVAYWSGTSALAGSANYTWNDSTGRLSVTKNQTTNSGITVTNGNAGVSAYAELVLSTDSGTGGVWMNSIANGAYGGAGSVNFGASGANRGASIVTNNASRLVVDATGTVNIGASALTDSGLNVTTNGASTWTVGGWNKTLKVGVDGSHATIRFPYNSSTQFGLGVTTDGIFRLIRSNNTNNAGTSNYDLTVDTSGNGSFNANLNVASKLTVGYGEAGYACATASSFCASNWFRSSGTTGWYNATYAVGMYAVQGGWVDTYNASAMRVNNLALGDMTGCGGYAGFMYYGLAGNCSNYAMIQQSNGATYVNASSGTAIYHRISNSDRLTVDANGVYGSGGLSCDYQIYTQYASLGFNTGQGLCQAGGGNRMIYGNIPVQSWGTTFSNFGCPAGACSSMGRSSVNLTVYGSAVDCTIGNGGGGTSCSSDARLKHDIVYTGPGSLDKIMQLQPVSYKFNIDTTNTNRLGFIAQDLVGVFPEAVSVNQEGYYMADYSTLISPIVGSIKELKVMADNLDARLSVLESGEFSGSIRVTHNAEIEGTLAVNGDTTLEKLTVNGDTEVQRITVVAGIKLGGVVNQDANVITKTFTASEEILAGQVVVLDSTNAGHVKLTTSVGDHKVIGIATNDTVLGDDVEVAVYGNLQVRVDTVTTVGIGDLMTSDSVAGMCRPDSSPATGTVVGKATSVKDINNYVWVMVALN
jgi:cytoskeletal protein CcmA (bactofilin family)